MEFVKEGRSMPVLRSRRSGKVRRIRMLILQEAMAEYIPRAAAPSYRVPGYSAPKMCVANGSETICASA